MNSTDHSLCLFCVYITTCGYGRCALLSPTTLVATGASRIVLRTKAHRVALARPREASAKSTAGVSLPRFGVRRGEWGTGLPTCLAGFVLSLPLMRDLPQQVVSGPSKVGHFHDRLRARTQHTREHAARVAAAL
jgi:hypothetical protein